MTTMTASRARAATPAERRGRYLQAQSRYNVSSKGQARNRAYEKRKGRGVRWEPARNALRSALGPAPEAPMNGGADLPPEVDGTGHMSQ
jgi:hypothetical protein